MWTLYPKRRTRRRKRDPNNHLGSIQSEANPKDGNEGNLPSAVIPDSSHRLEAPMAVDEVIVETSPKEKEKVTKTSHLPEVDIAAKDKRRLKIGLKASCLEVDPPLSIPTRQLPIEATIT
ncbi:hypothetical protein R1flu_026945 [Riccia fluitans]|uniref:Uncharacterized protein n=1 Tax=Riccia fluitans TaxID=41844 RepID=A0ABD1XHE3_9MARC